MRCERGCKTDRNYNDARSCDQCKDFFQVGSFNDFVGVARLVCGGVVERFFGSVMIDLHSKISTIVACQNTFAAKKVSLYPVAFIFTRNERTFGAVVPNIRICFDTFSNRSDSAVRRCAKVSSRFLPRHRRYRRRRRRRLLRDPAVLLLYRERLVLQRVLAVVRRSSAFHYDAVVSGSTSK